MEELRSPAGIDRALELVDRVRRMESDLARAVAELRAVVRELPRDERVELLSGILAAGRHRSRA